MRIWVLTSATIFNDRPLINLPNTCAYYRKKDEGDVRSMAYIDTPSKCPDSVDSCTLQIK